MKNSVPNLNTKLKVYFRIPQPQFLTISVYSQISINLFATSVNVIQLWPKAMLARFKLFHGQFILNNNNQRSHPLSFCVF